MTSATTSDKGTKRLTPAQHRIHKTTKETLKLLSQNIPTKQIAHTRKTTARNIRLLFQKYQERNLISADRELTEKGLELLNKPLPQSPVVSDSFPSSLEIRLHDLQFNLEILNKPKKWDTHRTTITKLKKYNPTKWRLNSGALFQEIVINSVTVRITPKSVLIKPQDIYAASPQEAVNKAVELLDSIIPQLESLFNIKLRKERHCNIKITRQHSAQIFNEIARHFLKQRPPVRLTVRDEGGAIRAITDDSHGLCELEFIHPRHSEDDAKIIQSDLQDKLLNKFIPSSEMSKHLAATVICLESIAKNTEHNTQQLTGVMNALKAIIPKPPTEIKEQEEIKKVTPSYFG